MPDRELDNVDRLGRLEGIQKHLQDLERAGFSYFQLPNLFAADPVAEPPYTVSSSFIPESIGGNIRVIHRDPGEDVHEPLDTENLEQMLGSYLPGGYKRRWGKFNLWQGRWEVVTDRPGRADIAPMFEFGDQYSLDELLGTEFEDHTGLELPTEEVTVYVPRVMYVERLPYDTVYRWHRDWETVFANQDPPGRTLWLGQSDPTTNYLWFRQYRDEPSGEPLELDGSDIVDGYRFEPETEFLRCYYASLLTLYEKENNDTLSRTLAYEHGGDERRAFVGAKERSQLLLFDLDRKTLRSRAAHVFSEHPGLKRDTQFSLLYREVWNQLFFDEGVLEHVFAVDPFVKHLVGVDFWCREGSSYDADSVFELSAEDLESVLETLLAPDSRLTLMGYEAAGASDVLGIVRNHGELVESMLETCRDEGTLLDFAEEVVVHSIEHALSTWATEETPAGGSFELWYDVNFQQRDDMIAPAGIYDSIQGGAGIATEVHDHLQTIEGHELDSGVAKQGACHTAAADRTVLELLSDHGGDVLYDLFEERRQRSARTEGDTDAEGESESEFRSRLANARDSVLGDYADAYNQDDLLSQSEGRIRSLFETRETARFYAYLASQYEELETRLERTPRSVDLLLYLDRDIIRDPRVRETYQRFAKGTQRRDLSELGERLEELTVQCVTACPDCLETEGQNCVHGMKYQSQMLNRRLLAEVCSY
jgi:hypothetical protein